MKIIGIEDSTFETVMERFNAFTSRIRKICGKDKATEKWMDNQDVCNLLDISKRTLQSYRDKGILPYSQIGHKCFYKASDVEKLISGSRIEKSQNEH